MSDTEKTDASPQKEEIKEEPNMVEEKTNENERHEEEMEAEAEEEKEVKGEILGKDIKEEEKTEEPESKPGSEDSTPKKSPKKKKKIEKREEEEEEELPLGLLERPVVIESGKREKRKVERLSMTMTFNPAQKKKVDVPEGTGTKLGECPRIEYKLTHMKADDLKSLHRILFGKKGTQIEVKRNLRQFCGFSFTKEDKEYKSRLVSVGKLTLPVLKSYCELLDLEKSGVKEDVVQRVMDFLMHPVDSGKKVPEPKKRGRASKGERKSGVKRKRAEKKEGTKKKKTSKDNDDENQEEDNDEEDDVENDNEEEEEEDEDGDVDDEGSEEEAPKKKKPKLEVKKSKKDSEDKKEKNDKKEKKEKSPKKEKKEPKKKKVPSSDEDDDDDDGDDTKKSGPPNNDELRDVVKKILDGANLEEVTMKTVVKQVYAKYPEFDLTDKKEFIKNTVKQLIS